MATASNSDGIVKTGSAWFQRKVNLRPVHRGCHLITDELLKQIPELSKFTVGLFHVQSNLFSVSIVPGCVCVFFVLFFFKKQVRAVCSNSL